MLAHEARTLAGSKYAEEFKLLQQQIYQRAYNGYFSLVVKEPISDYVRTRLQGDGYALSKTVEWWDLVSW